MKFPSLAAVAVVGACAAAASRLAVVPALGLLSTADAFGFVRPDPAVQVVAGVWTMTGVNVEDALANGDVIAAAIADVAGVAASQVVIDGVSERGTARPRPRASGLEPRDLTLAPRRCVGDDERSLVLRELKSSSKGSGKSNAPHPSP